MACKTALVVLAEGAEEMEAVISIDVLRRAKIDVTVAGLVSKDVVKCSRGVNVQPDVALSDVVDKLFDVVVLPGGLGGAELLAQSVIVKELLERHSRVGNLIAAICAAPTAVAAHGIYKGKNITSYPTLKDKFTDYVYIEKNVVQDGNLLTSRGPGTAFEFALEIVSVLISSSVAKDLTQSMLL